MPSGSFPFFLFFAAEPEEEELEGLLLRDVGFVELEALSALERSRAKCQSSCSIRRDARALARASSSSSTSSDIAFDFDFRCGWEGSERTLRQRGQVNENLSLSVVSSKPHD